MGKDSVPSYTIMFPSSSIAANKDFTTFLQFNIETTNQANFPREMELEFSVILPPKLVFLLKFADQTLNSPSWLCPKKITVSFSPT